jgi:hypothetical protein
MSTESRRPGRPSDYYTAKDVKAIFAIGLSTVYRKPDEFGGRWVAGTLRFPKAIVDSMRRKDAEVIL